MFRIVRNATRLNLPSRLPVATALRPTVSFSTFTGSQNGTAGGAAPRGGWFTSSRVAGLCALGGTLAALALGYHGLLPDRLRGHKMELAASSPSDDSLVPAAELPVVDHPVVFAPAVPPPITRRHRALVRMSMETSVVKKRIHGDLQYEYWTFNGEVPGPFIRCRFAFLLFL